MNTYFRPNLCFYDVVLCKARLYGTPRVGIEQL